MKIISVEKGVARTSVGQHTPRTVRIIPVNY